MIDKSSLEHGTYAVVMQVIIATVAQVWVPWVIALVIGAAWSSAYFVSREAAQQEYKLAAGTSRKGLEWRALDVTKWSKLAQQNALVPMAVVLLVIIGARVIGG